MVAAGDAGLNGVAERLGIKPDMVVQETGLGRGRRRRCSRRHRGDIGGELLDEDADEVIDVVLLWWRDDDGDLGDALVDARAPAGRERRRLGADPEDRSARARRTQRDRRSGAHGRHVPDRQHRASVPAGPGPRGWCRRSKGSGPKADISVGSGAPSSRVLAR